MIFRVYFNRKKEAPQVWSVDYGTQESEINAQNVYLIGCNAATVFRPEGVKDFENEPCAWFEIEAARAIFDKDGISLYAN